VHATARNPASIDLSGVVPLRLDIIDPETTVKKGQPVSVHISSRRPGKPYCRRSGKLAAWTEENLPT
jgi:hypothetical protein